MTRESDSGSRTPEGTDAFSPTAQLADFADDESRWNTVIRVDDATERNALTAPELRDGIIAVQRDDHTGWLYTGGGWELIGGVRVAGTVTAGSNVTVAASTTLVKRGRDVMLNLTVTRTTGNHATGDAIATLPAGFRPAAAIGGAGAMNNATLVYFTISSAGVVNIFFTGSAGSATSIAVAFPVA